MTMGTIGADDVRRLLESTEQDATLVVVEGRARVVPAGELAAATDEVSQRILDVSEEGTRLTKAALRSTKQLLLAAMSASAEMNVAALGKPDLHAAFDAFLSGRTMSWRALRPGFAPEPAAAPR